jgi:subtilisin-like proprotein convertase family protein
MRVKINMLHSNLSDMTINLKAPNGQLLNLFYQHGGSGDHLVNTVISSQGTVAFTPVASDAPFTGTFKATAATNVGPTGYKSNATSFAQLYTIPSGNWTLAMLDAVGSSLGGTLTFWEIEFF